MPRNRKKPKPSSQPADSQETPPVNPSVKPESSQDIQTPAAAATGTAPAAGRSGKVVMDSANNTKGEILRRFGHYIAYGLGDHLFTTKVPVPLTTVEVHTSVKNAAKGDYRAHHKRTALKGEETDRGRGATTSVEIQTVLASDMAARLLNKAISSTINLRGEDLVSTIPDLFDSAISNLISQAPTVFSDSQPSQWGDEEADVLTSIFNAALKQIISTAEIAGKLTNSQRTALDEEYVAMLKAVGGTIGLKVTVIPGDNKVTWKDESTTATFTLAKKTLEGVIQRLNTDPYTGKPREDSFQQKVVKLVCTMQNLCMMVQYRVAARQGATLEQLRTTQTPAEIYAATALETAIRSDRNFGSKRDKAFKAIRAEIEKNAQAGKNRRNANSINWFRPYLQAVKRHVEGGRRNVTIEEACSNIKGVNDNSPYSEFIRSCDALLIDATSNPVANVPIGEVMVDLNPDFPYIRPTNVVGYTAYSMPMYANASVKSTTAKNYQHGRYTSDVTRSGLLHWLYLQIQEMGGAEIEWDSSHEDIAHELRLIAEKYFKDNHLNLRVFQRGNNFTPELHPGELGAVELLYFDIFSLELIRRCLLGQKGSGWTGRLNDHYKDDHHKRQDEIILAYPREVETFAVVMDAHTAAFKTMLEFCDTSADFCDDPAGHGGKDYLDLFHARLQGMIVDIRLPTSYATGGQMFLDEVALAQGFVTMKDVLSEDMAIADIDGFTVIHQDTSGFFTIGRNDCITNNFLEIPLATLSFPHRDLYNLGEVVTRYGRTESFPDAFLGHILSLRTAKETYDQVRLFLSKPFRDEAFGSGHFKRELKYGSCKEPSVYSAMFRNFLDKFYEAKSLSEGLVIGGVKMALRELINLGVLTINESETFEEELLNYHHKIYAQVKGGASIIRIPCFIDDAAPDFKAGCSLTGKDMMPAVNLFYEAFILAPTDLAASMRAFEPEYIVNVTGSTDRTEGERLFAEKAKADPTLLNPLVKRFCTGVHPFSWATITRHAGQGRDFYAREDNGGNYLGAKIEIAPVSYNGINTQTSNA